MSPRTLMPSAARVKTGSASLFCFARSSYPVCCHPRLRAHKTNLSSFPNARDRFGQNLTCQGLPTPYAAKRRACGKIRCRAVKS